MAYQALYRKWRPQTFDDMVGQSAVTHTLKNAISNHKTSHAYLFTGPRGTGKTSAAKVFAKAINCPNQTNGEPCNECDICKGITNGTIGDVIEIDAASNNGVEEIRDIRDKARYAPTQAEYKIYIIDEVHMLSTGAFNALLKTLEEPPQKVIFILATTEPHKIPATIISRTQRFDFRRITSQEIIDRLAYILGQEGIEYEADALSVVARCANGGMRDALSLLDQMISFGDGKVTLDEAIQVSGSLTDDLMIDFVKDLQETKAEEALDKLQQLFKIGKEASRLVEEWLEFARDLLIAKQSGEAIGRSERFLQFKDEVEPEFLYRFVEALNQTQQEMRFTTKPTISLEVLTIKMAQPYTLTPRPSSGAPAMPSSEEVQQLQQQIAQMQQQMNALLQGGAPQAQQAPKTSAPRPTRAAFKPNTTAIQKILTEATREDLLKVRELWGDLLSCLNPQEQALLSQSTVNAAGPNGFVLGFAYDHLCDISETRPGFREVIQGHLERLGGYSGTFVAVTQHQWPQIRADFLQERKKNQEEEAVSIVTEEPAVEEALTPEEQAFEQKVNDTIELFGEEIVQIEE